MTVTVVEAAERLNADATETGAPFVFKADEATKQVDMHVVRDGEALFFGSIDFPTTEDPEFYAQPKGLSREREDSYEGAAVALTMLYLIAGDDVLAD
jgi:hypothetical protein